MRLLAPLLLFGFLALVPAARADEAILYRPMLADRNESLVRTRISSFTQDLRYGTDIFDSTSTGGWLEDQKGVGWAIGAGKTFRTPPWRTVFGWPGPWQRYQLTASAGLRSSFERFEAQYLNVNDFQFGAGAEAQWAGAWDERPASGAFDRPVVTTRTGFHHRSSHVGDEYVAQGRFGRNQNGEGLLERPPIKRSPLSYEVLQQLVSVEWSPRGGAATWRGYAGAEWKLGTMGRRPGNYRSPAAQAGVEFRSAGNLADPGADPLSSWINGIFRQDRFAFTWIAAFDLRLAKPYDFASLDNPAGTGEVWTPHLWSEGAHGREFRRYAGSWHALAGLSLWNRGRRSVSRGGRLIGPETAIALEWFGGYSPNATFLDMRRRDHPRWYVVPSIITTF